MKIKYRMKNSERILLQFKDDERKGFRLLYDSFYDSLVLFATQFIGEAEEAADFVQECFVDFWVNRRFSLLQGSLERCPPVWPHRCCSRRKDRPGKGLRQTEGRPGGHGADPE